MSTVSKLPLFNVVFPPCENIVSLYHQYSTANVVFSASMPLTQFATAIGYQE
ncbi:hypothetical protein [Kaarinaea lacus]